MSGVPLATAPIEGFYFGSDLLAVGDVQCMRFLEDDQQRSCCNRFVPDLLQLGDDLMLAGNILVAKCNARLGLR
jgi:hypothetical protein